MSSSFASNATTFLCRCHSPEHQLTFVANPYNDIDDSVYVYIHLKTLPFWKRLWHGIKYIFGHRSIYGDFDEFIFNEEDAGNLQKIVDLLKLSQERNKQPRIPTVERQ